MPIGGFFCISLMIVGVAFACTVARPVWRVIMASLAVTLLLVTLLTKDSVVTGYMFIFMIVLGASALIYWYKEEML